MGRAVGGVDVVGAGMLGVCFSCFGFLLRKTWRRVKVKNPVATKSHEKRLTAFSLDGGELGEAEALGVSVGVGVVEVVEVMTKLVVLVWLEGISSP